MRTADYAAPPGTGSVVYDTDQLDAELALAPIAGKLMSFSGPAMPVRELVVLALYVVGGVGLRGYLPPTFAHVGEACVILLSLALVIPVVLRAPGKEEPQWARAAAVHRDWLAGRVPAPVYQQLTAVMNRMTAGTRWQGAYLYVARCTSKEPVHYEACCAGGTYPRQGRLLVIVGEHLVYGRPEIALGILAHERRHVTPLRVRLYFIATVAGSLGLMVAGWAVPWPVLLLAAAGVRLAAVAVLWAVEVSCDVGAARETSAAAMIETVNYKQRTKEGSRALWPAAQRRTVSILTWVTGPEHPPYAMRRWLISTLAG